jgi:hypothetical protein
MPIEMTCCIQDGVIYVRVCIIYVCIGEGIGTVAGLSRAIKARMKSRWTVVWGGGGGREREREREKKERGGGRGEVIIGAG